MELDFNKPFVPSNAPPFECVKPYIQPNTIDSISTSVHDREGQKSLLPIASNKDAKFLQIRETERLSPSFKAYRRRQKERMVKGSNTEQVWPEEMEIVFLEGGIAALLLRTHWLRIALALSNIPELGRRRLFLNGKHCGRNEWISYWILKRSGVKRDRKQISSHIQTLKPMLRNLPICEKSAILTSWYAFWLTLIGNTSSKHDYCNTDLQSRDASFRLLAEQLSIRQVPLLSSPDISRFEMASQTPCTFLENGPMGFTASFLDDSQTILNPCMPLTYTSPTSETTPSISDTGVFVRQPTDIEVQDLERMDKWGLLSDTRAGFDIFDRTPQESHTDWIYSSEYVQQC